MMNHVQAETGTATHNGLATEETKKPSARKILVVLHAGGVKEFDTKSEASGFINEVGADAVASVYTGAKPGQVKVKTKFTL